MFPEDGPCYMGGGGLQFPSRTPVWHQISKLCRSYKKTGTHWCSHLEPSDATPAECSLYCAYLLLYIRVSHETSSSLWAHPFGPAVAFVSVSPGKVQHGFLMARVHLWSKNINLILSFWYTHSVRLQCVLHYCVHRPTRPTYDSVRHSKQIHYIGLLRLW